MRDGSSASASLILRRASASTSARSR